MGDNTAVQNRTDAPIKLSLIVISYNEAEYLPEALDSCLGQKGMEDFEIIIGDDGSSDNSLQIIQRYAEQYPGKVRYYVNSRDDGVTIAPIRVSNSIKKAMAMARGEYLAVLSGDDFFCDLNRFSADIAFLDAHPKYIACGSDFKLLHDDGTEQPYKWYGFSPALAWGGAYVHISCFTFRRRVYEKGLLQYFCDDCGLVYSIGCCGDWCYRPKTTFAYRQRTQSIMHEAKKLELTMLELLLLQDVLQNGQGQRIATWSHFAKPIVTAFFKRNRLTEVPRCKEYLQISAQQTPDLLTLMTEFDIRPIQDRLRFLGQMFWACCCNRFCWAVRAAVIVFAK